MNIHFESLFARKSSFQFSECRKIVWKQKTSALVRMQMQCFKQCDLSLNFSGRVKWPFGRFWIWFFTFNFIWTLFNLTSLNTGYLQCIFYHVFFYSLFLLLINTWNLTYLAWWIIWWFNCFLLEKSNLEFPVYGEIVWKQKRQCWCV